jgi:phage gp36-like protein
LVYLLVDVLEVEFHRYRASKLADLVALVQNIKGADAQRLKEACEDASERYESVLDRWLQCVKGLVTFNKDTRCGLASGFEGDEKERCTFLQKLPFRKRLEVMRPVQDIYIAVGDWLEEPEFTLETLSSDLAFVFLQMTDRIDEGLVRQDELVEMLIGFNAGLLSWFSKSG